MICRKSVKSSLAREGGEEGWSRGRRSVAGGAGRLRDAGRSGGTRTVSLPISFPTLLRRIKAQEKEENRVFVALETRRGETGSAEGREQGAQLTGSPRASRAGPIAGAAESPRVALPLPSPAPLARTVDPAQKYDVPDHLKREAGLLSETRCIRLLSIAQSSFAS